MYHFLILFKTPSNCFSTFEVITAVQKSSFLFDSTCSSPRLGCTCGRWRRWRFHLQPSTTPPSSGSVWWSRWPPSGPGGSRGQEPEYLEKQVVNNDLRLRRAGEVSLIITSLQGTRIKWLCQLTITWHNDMSAGVFGIFGSQLFQFIAL